MTAHKFHFQEINLIIYFPAKGNENREYPRYGVRYLNRTTRVSQTGKATSLEEALNKPEIRENYPHTVRYYLDSSGRGQTFAPEYLETRTIIGVKEFFRFLRDLEI